MQTHAEINAAQQIEQFLDRVRTIREQLHKVVVGQDETIDQLLVCALTGSHALLVGVPGLAKTLMVKALAAVFRWKFNRIQFTPDLMPADITGYELLGRSVDGEGPSMVFRRGPVFANLLLADEINRAAPKTQSALLEAMAERHVTVGGQTLSDLEEPFVVIATQNPIEQEGTYPLPEAQLDRFMMEIRIGYPTPQQEREIVLKTTSGPSVLPSPQLDRGAFLQLRDLVWAVPLADHVVEYAVRLCGASRPGNNGSDPYIRDYIAFGAGPRGSQNLVLAAKARALLMGRTTVTADDVRAVRRGAQASHDSEPSGNWRRYQCGIGRAASGCKGFVMTVASATHGALRSPYLDLRALASLSGMRFTTRGQLTGTYSGRHRSQRHGGAGEFVDFREYGSGEDLRRLDWKVFARTGKAFVRLHQDETNLLCTLAIDSSRSMAFPDQSEIDPRGSKLTYTRYLATALSHVISLGQDQVGVAVLGENADTLLPPGGTTSHVAHVQKIIAELTTQKATAMAPALRRLYEAARRSSVLILFSDFLMDDLEAVFARLRMFRHDRCEVIALHLVHPNEERLPAGAAFRFFDPEGTGQLPCTPAEIRREYEQKFTAHLAIVRQMALAIGCDYRPAFDGDALLANVAWLFD